MSKARFTNQAVLGTFRAWGKSLAAAASFHNVYCMMLLLMGVGMLLRPQNAALTLLAGDHISISMYAMLFIAFGAWGVNRALSKELRIWLAFPLLLHTGLTWLSVLLQAEAELTPAVIYTAACIWLLTRE